MWLFVLAFLVAIVALLGGLLKYYAADSDFWPTKGVYLVPKSHIGNFGERVLFKVPLQELDMRIYKSIRAKKLRFGGFEAFRSPSFVPTDLDLIKVIMIKDFEHFANRRVFESQKRDKYFKDMMTIKENQEWKDLRSTITPTFTTGKIKRMFDIFDQCSSKIVTFIKTSTSDSKKEVEISDPMGRYTLDVIAWSAFGVDSQVFQDKNSLFAKMGLTFEKSFEGLWGIAKVICLIILPKIGAFFNVQFAEAKSARFFTDVIQKTISHRVKTGERRQDFLQLLLDTQAGQLKAEENENIDDQFERDAAVSGEKANKIRISEDILISQCLLFFLAGYSTTQNLLIFAAYELALNPDIQEKLAKEIEDASKGNNGKLSYEMINNLEFLEQVTCETLRKYPPGFRTERVTNSNYKVPDSDVIIPKGTTILIPIWAIHYDTEYYQEPGKFLPERFTAENKANRHPLAYIPFGAGPRNCIAMRFALIEAKTAIAKLVQNFILEPNARTAVPVQFGKINLKPDDGIWLMVKPRGTQCNEE